MYELWELISYGHMEPLHPAFLICKSRDFSQIHLEFSRNIKLKPCVIVYNNQKEGGRG
jgi:hypothetical protein